MWERQQKRADLADEYWRLAGARPGWRVADVGCGPGWFALRYAAMTGPTGHVHAVDADEGALEFLRAQIDPIHHAHVTTEALDVEKAPIPDLHFDAVFCTDLLHHANDLAAVLRNVHAPRATLVVAEFDPHAPGDMGPPVEDRIEPRDLMRALDEAGWAAGPWRALRHEHYAIVARPRS